MKFVIEGLGLTGGGGKASMLRLLPSLGRQTAHEFVLLLQDLPEYSTISAPNLKLIVRPKPGNLIARHIYLNHTVPRICRQQGADALLCMGNFAPLRSNIPTVLFVRNAYYVYRDDVASKRATFRERLKIRYGWKHYGKLPPAVNVVVQTELMKQRLAASHHLDPSRIVVIPDTDALPPGCTGQVGPRERTASDPFTFLYLSAYSPHKNQEILLEAMTRLPLYSRRSARCMITLAPEQHPGARRLLEQIKQRKLDNLVVNIGPVSGAEMAKVYLSADAAIQPTLLESFGRVYYESMRFDLPLLASDRDFAHVVCQDAADFFDPLDGDSVAKSMARIMGHAELRQRLIENGRRILALAPTWNEIAANFVDVLERTARGEPPVRAASDLCHAANNVRMARGSQA